VTRALRHKRPHRDLANSRIRYVPNELAAVKRFEVALIIMVGKAPTAELASTFVNTLHSVDSFVASRTPPFIAKVYRPTATELARSAAVPGHIELWFPRR
jgi:hypothetical protein